MDTVTCPIKEQIWKDDCLMANSADVITMVQYEIANDMRVGDDMESIAFNNNMTMEELGYQISELNKALVHSKNLLESGDKKYVYDCANF